MMWLMMNILTYWKLLVKLLLFLAIALLSINLIFSPTMKAERGHYVELGEVGAIDGMQMRARIWKTYPQTNIGLGCIAILAFAGALYEVYSLYELKLRDVTEETEVAK